MSDADGAGPSRSRRLARLRVGQSLSITIGTLLAFAVIGIGLALVANERLTNSRNLLLNQIGPSLRSAIQLENGLVNQETGLRGYLIAVQASFLAVSRARAPDATISPTAAVTTRSTSNPSSEIAPCWDATYSNGSNAGITSST